jgi:low temperature requirement protein LtrA
MFAISSANMVLKGLSENLDVAIANFLLSLALLNIGIMIMSVRVLLSKTKDSMYYASNVFTFHFFATLAWIAFWALSGSRLLLICGCALMTIININRIDCYIKIGQHLTSRWLSAEFPRATVPLHVGLTAERFGLFFILGVGECVMGTVGKISVFSFKSALALLLASIQGFFFKVCYFDMFDCMGEHVKKHAIKESKVNGLRLMNLHSTGVMGVTLSAGLIVRVFYQKSVTVGDTPLAVYSRLLYSGAFAIALLSFWHIHRCHSHFHDDPALCGISENVAIHIIAVIIVAVAFIPITNPLALQSLLLILFFCGMTVGVFMEKIQGHVVFSDGVAETKLLITEVNSVPKYESANSSTVINAGSRK